MNLLLHSIGKPDGPSLIEVKDSLIADPGTRWSVVLSNPPFGRKSSITMVGANGRETLRRRMLADFSYDELSLLYSAAVPLVPCVGHPQEELS